VDTQRLKRSPTLSLTIASLLLAGCAGGSSGGGFGAGTAAPASTNNGAAAPGASGSGQALASGRFRLLIYNVAGLPKGISKSNPSVFTPQISPLLNSYDIVLAQEDFSYHRELASRALHPFQSMPMTPSQTIMNDGLNRFSRSLFFDFSRTRWNDCNGWLNAANDCLAAKGFSMGRHELSPGIFVDIYNVHADAGRSSGDAAARRSEFEQLTLAIQAQSAGNAVIVAGDTNLKTSRTPEDAVTLDGFLKANRLVSSAQSLGQPTDRIDKVLFRSHPQLQLKASSWRTASEFIDPQGRDLSDHLAVHVDFEWRELP